MCPNTIDSKNGKSKCETFSQDDLCNIFCDWYDVSGSYKCNNGQWIGDVNCPERMSILFPFEQIV